MHRFLTCAAAVLAVAAGACDTPITSPEILDPQAGTPLTGPVGEAFTPGGATLLTGSASDAWPELEGDYVAWYRAAPAEEEGLWLMDLRTGDASRIWAGTVGPEMDLVDGRVYWGSADALLVHDIASGVTQPLASGYRHYRHVSVGPRYIVGSAWQSSFRPFVFDRADGTEVLIPTSASVPMTRGWGDWILYSYALTNTVAQLYLYHIPTASETPITDQDQLLTAANADLSGGRAVYFGRRFCPGSLELYEMEAKTTAPLPLGTNCPQVVLLDGDVLVYRHNASGGVIYLGFMDLTDGETLAVPVQNPGNWRIDADLDGTRVVHTSAEGLTLFDLRFETRQPPVADAGGPYEVVEGGDLTLDGSGSYSPTDASLSYLWTLPDGTTLDGVHPTWSWEDDGVFPVSLTVSEEGGLSDEDQASVTVLNAPPTVALGPAGAQTRSTPTLSGVEGEAVTLVAHFSDPGLRDAPWKWSVSWDGGVLASGAVDVQGALPPVTWTPDTPGSFTVVVRVEDKDGGTSELEIPLMVEKAPLPPLTVHAGSGARHTVPALESRGVFPVVAFGMPEATAADFDAATFRLGPGAAAPLMGQGHAPRVEDRDGDGLEDLVLHFRVTDVGLEPGDQEVCLTGATLAGDGLQGCSPIRIAGRVGR